MPTLTETGLEQAQRFVKAVSVVVTSAVTIAAGAAVVLTEFSDEIVQVLPDGTGQAIARGALVAAGWLLAATRALRRVTPVPEGARGLTLPQRAVVDRTDTRLMLTAPRKAA